MQLARCRDGLVHNEFVPFRHPDPGEAVQPHPAQQVLKLHLTRVAGNRLRERGSRLRRSQFHPDEALIEPRIRAQAVPVRPHGEMKQGRVVRVEHSLKMLESSVEVSNFRALQHEVEFPKAYFALRHDI